MLINGHVRFPAELPEGRGEGGIRIPGQIDGTGQPVPQDAALLLHAGNLFPGLQVLQQADSSHWRAKIRSSLSTQFLIIAYCSPGVKYIFEATHAGRSHRRTMETRSATAAAGKNEEEGTPEKRSPDYAQWYALDESQRGTVATVTSLPRYNFLVG